MRRIPVHALQGLSTADEAVSFAIQERLRNAKPVCPFFDAHLTRSAARMGGMRKPILSAWLP